MGLSERRYTLLVNPGLAPRPIYNALEVANALPKHSHVRGSVASRLKLTKVPPTVTVDYQCADALA
ncbi:hypothetical protein RSO01_93710 [Reyranella soli]|uniref:Uncharacterized protein n=1 Tax=Reyranella soli TaxID=1230389 RepID=A0A512NTC4_9HYPH|nr:hypothetical protein RSO01_93710 [Reyranella soli]